MYLQSVVSNRKLLFAVLEVGTDSQGPDPDPQELLKDLHTTELMTMLCGHFEHLTWQSCWVP